MRLKFDAAAEQDLLEAAQFYANRTAGLGVEFLGEMAKVVDRVREHPTRFGVVEDDVRYCAAKRFLIPCTTVSK